MRCPHCSGELPPESQYCGVCGLNINTSHNHLSPSLFALPVSKGARAVRVAMVLGINLLMAGAGVTLIIQYLHKRDQVAHASAPVSSPIASPNHEPTAVIPAMPSANVRPLQPESKPTQADTEAGAGKPVNHKAHDTQAKPSPSSSSTPTSTPKPTSSKKSHVDAGSSDSPAPLPAPVSDAAVTLSEEEEAAQIAKLAGKIGLVVRRHQPQLRRCYQNALKQGTPKDPLQGKINLRFTVQPDGSANAVHVVSNTTGSPALANCLVGLVRGWEFPATNSTPADFVWPFEFQAP